MKLTVVLGASEEASFDIILYDNSFTSKWLDELSWCLRNCEFNQVEAFASLCTIDQTAENISQSCRIINNYIPNFIEIRDNIPQQPQEYFNYLHVKFEKLSGEFGNPTRLFSIAPPDLKDAIRNLNFFVHQTETKRAPSPALYFSFDKDTYRRQRLTDSDYDFFDFNIPAGTLVLHYVELGKEYYDLYQDGLPIEYPALKNLHYYSGEASMVFTDRYLLGDPNYTKWLVTHGIDPYNKKLGHGKIPLGIAEDLGYAQRVLLQYPYLNKILIKE